MKKLLLSAALAVGVSTQASPFVESSLMLSQAAKVLAEIQPQNAINWSVGDFHDFALEMEGFGALGNGHKEVTKDVPEQNALWYVQKIDAMGQAQTVETLLSRTDGKVLRQIVNGEEKSVGDGKDAEIEILEQSETEITVPAGTFECMYVKARIKQEGQTQDVELWVNPIDVNLDGMLKLNINSQYGVMSMILQKFGSAGR